jgi:hypothetical protein
VASGERSAWRGLTVAGLRLAVEAPASLPWRWPEGPLRLFTSAPGEPDVMVHVRVGRARALAPESVAYDSEGGIFDVSRDGSDWVFTLRIRGALCRLARFDADFREGVVLVDPDSFYARQCHYPLAYPLDELIYLHRLARDGGLLLHACAVVRQGVARLFTGRSGAGKTTIARLMLGDGAASVLSDDRVVVRRVGDGFRAFGTPWHGDEPLASPSGARLDAIHSIHQAHRLEARRLAAGGAAAAVLGNAFLPLHDRTAADRTLALVQAIVERVTICDLDFPLDPAVVPFVWEGAAAPVAV